MSERKRLVVIGGVAAGMSAASKARRVNPDLEIVVFEQGDWISYSACGLPYFVGGLVENERKLIARTVAEFARQGIEVRLHHAVTSIDTRSNRVASARSRVSSSAVPASVLVITSNDSTRRTLAQRADRAAASRVMGGPPTSAR